MKKLFILALCVMNFALCINLKAQKSCATIAEIRSLTDSIEVLYTGEAITTFYGTGGMLIQDATGAIYIKHIDMSKYSTTPAKAARPNLKISNIRGIFHHVDDMEMTHIEMKYDYPTKIEVKEENVDFTIKDVELADLMANPMAYECQAIRLTEVAPIVTQYSKYFKLGDKELNISTGQMGEAMAVPAEGTFVGYYGNNGNQGFIIPEEKYITATGYNSIFELKESQAVEHALSIVQPVLVNRAVKNNDGTTLLYIQQDYSWWGTFGTTVVVENLPIEVKEGDSISGVRGIMTKFRFEEGKVYGSKIEQKGDLGAQIKIINSNNSLYSDRVQELEYINGEGAINHESTLRATPVGTIVKHGEKYFLRVVNTNTNMVDSVYIHGADFSALLGKNHAIIGIVDAGIINPGRTTMVVRTVHDILLDNYQFETVAEMRAAGSPLATDVTYELVNPVLVTYKRDYMIDGAVHLIGVHVQDATGGCFVKKQISGNETFEINAGDSVTNLKGVFVNTSDAGYMLDFTDLHGTQEDTYVIKSSGHVVDANPINVTLDELYENRYKYSSMVVHLENLQLDKKEQIIEGYTTYQNYLYQDGCEHVMFFNFEYPLFAKTNIVGVFDDACDNIGFTIIPLSKNHVTSADGSGPITAIETVENNLTIAYNNGTIFVSEDIDAIEIYSVNGVLVMKENVNSSTVAADLTNGIYVVRLFNGGEVTTAKIAVK